MIKMRSILVLFFFVVTLGSCSSAQQNKNKEMLRVSVAGEPRTADPRKAGDLQSIALVKMLGEGLTRIDLEEEPNGAVADSVEISSDLKTYTFHLRESYWTNGDRVTASDFAYSWKSSLNPKFASDTAFQLYVIKNAHAVKSGIMGADELGVRVIDENTLEVTLEQPTPYFLELVAFPSFFPVNAKIDQKNPRWAERIGSYVGNGPFVVQSWQHQGHIVLTKSLSYWDAANVQIPALEMVVVEEGTACNMFEKNGLDWVGSPLSIVPTDNLEHLKAEGLLKSKEMLGTYFVRCNVNQPFLNNVNIRKALSLALNREMIVEHVLHGSQTAASGLLPRSLRLSNKSYFEDVSVEKARVAFNKGLKELKISKDKIPEITLSYPSDERNHLLAQTLQQEWHDAFGIRVQLQATERKVYYDQVAKQNYQLAIGSWIADFRDPVNFLEVFKYKTGGSNHTSWENKDYIELLDRSMGEANPYRRYEMLAKAEGILMEEMPIIPVFHYNMLYMNRPAVSDVVLSSLGGIDFRWARLDEPKQLEGSGIVQGEGK